MSGKMKAWKGIIAMTLLQKCFHETRPYEVTRGDSDHLYGVYRDRVHQTVKSANGAMESLLDRMKNDFRTLPLRKERKPMIGIIGEIFVRSLRLAKKVAAGAQFI